MDITITRLSRAFLALILGALLALQFWSLRAPSRLHLPEQQRVVTSNPKIGVHTRLTGLSDEAYIASSLQQVREMGAGWIVDLFPWANAVLPSQRLRWTVDAYAIGKQWDWLAAMCLWQFATPWSTHTYQDNWSFVASDGTPKAIYWAMRDAAQK